MTLWRKHLEFPFKVLRKTGDGGSVFLIVCFQGKLLGTLCRLIHGVLYSIVPELTVIVLVILPLSQPDIQFADVKLDVVCNQVPFADFIRVIP